MTEISPRPERFDAPVVSTPAGRGVSPSLAVVMGVLGLALGAALVGIPWLLTGNSGNPAGGPIAAPATLNSFEQFQVAAAHVGGPNAAVVAGRASTEDVRNSQRLSNAYSGAPAVVMRYSDDRLDETINLLAVRANTPDPYVPYEDAAQLGLAVPPDQLTQVGDVACALVNQPTPAGREPAPESITVSYCQHTGSYLTVQVRPTGGAVQHSPDEVAALVDAAWAQLS